MYHRNGGVVAETLADAEAFAQELKALNVTPAFVFDGATTGMKPRAHRLRQETANKQVAAVTQLGRLISATEAVLSSAPATSVKQLSTLVADADAVRAPAPVPAPLSPSVPLEPFTVSKALRAGTTTSATAQLAAALQAALAHTELVSGSQSTTDTSVESTKKSTELVCETLRLQAPAQASSPAHSARLHQIAEAMSDTDNVHVACPSPSTQDAVKRADTAPRQISQSHLASLQASLGDAKARWAKADAASRRPPSEVWSGVRRVLTTAFGTNAVQTAPDDAERHVAKLVMEGAADFAASTDYDTLFFGSPHVVLHFTDKRKMVRVDLAEVLDMLQVTRHQLVDFALLCGCDFCDKVPGIGPVTALRLMHTYGSIEAMYDKELKHRLEAGCPFEYAYGRKRYFENTPGAEHAPTPPILINAPPRSSVAPPATKRAKVTIATAPKLVRTYGTAANVLPAPLPMDDLLPSGDALVITRRSCTRQLFEELDECHHDSKSDSDATVAYFSSDDDSPCFIRRASSEHARGAVASAANQRAQKRQLSHQEGRACETRASFLDDTHGVVVDKAKQRRDALLAALECDYEDEDDV
jgi:hypothetical protein